MLQKMGLPSAALMQVDQKELGDEPVADTRTSQRRFFDSQAINLSVSLNKAPYQTARGVSEVVVVSVEILCRGEVRSSKRWEAKVADSSSLSDLVSV
jgi:hypothetical protein